MHLLPRALHVFKKGTLAALLRSECFVNASLGQEAWAGTAGLCHSSGQARWDEPWNTLQGKSGSLPAEERGLVLLLSWEMGCSV